jgi:quinolinate synthase
MSSIPERIEAIREKLGKRLLILGHHYQRASVLAHADALGDSLELARRAAAEKEAKKIVFCGVHFMAETADLLTKPDQIVYMPEPAATCPMANMADEADVREARDRLQRAEAGRWTPVVYVNSTAAVKALCGQWGGSACTSSNAGKVFQRAFSKSQKIFFLPDEHLGINTAEDLGFKPDETRVYDPAKPDGGLTDKDLAAAKVVAWKGYCHVHTAFRTSDVKAVHKRDPSATIIVHPETPRVVLRLCDAHGSTSQIIKYVRELPEGSIVYVGTELHLVERLAAEHAGRVTVKALRPSACPNMHMTTEENLLELLETWPAVNEIHVHDDVAANARVAVERMLA